MGGRVGTTLALALALLALTPDVSSRGAAWPGRKVVVRDHSSPGWRPHVRDMVARFNRAMPGRVPRLVYRPRPVRSCNDLKIPKRKRQIWACTPSSESSYVNPAYRRHTLRRAKVALRDSAAPAQRPNLACHEFMHALTDIPDAPIAKWRADSCVHGRLDEPGAFDVAYARKVYRQHGR